MRPTFSIEQSLLEKGFSLIAGVDEAGRGPLAGPVVAAAVILPPGCVVRGLDDSKKLSAAKRNRLFRIIKKKAVSLGVGVCGREEIDRYNILQASLRAMKIAVEQLVQYPDMVIIDGGNTIPGIKAGQRAVINGDAICASVAAASIIAKVTRDRIMIKLHKKHPQYCFNSNKGYATKFHLEAIEKYGIISEHRMSFCPVKNCAVKALLTEPRRLP